MAAFFVYRTHRIFRETTYVTELSNEEMAARYRFTNEGVDALEDLLREDLERATKRNKALTVRAMILITLRFLATGAFFNVVGDRMGYHKCTVSRVVAQVTDALCTRLRRFVVWPNQEARRRSVEAFYDVAGFPYVVGCVDGSHIRIQAPIVDEPAFVNRNSQHQHAGCV